MTRTVSGFRFGGTTCGLKKSGKSDLALLLTDEDVAAAAVFTKNRVKAAPVVLSRDRIKRGVARGVLVNAGNANACTGAAGMSAAEAMTSAVAETAGVPVGRLLVASTGIIGVPLPVEKIVAARHALLAATTATSDGFDAFANAILTTDKGPKTASATVTLGKHAVRLLGCTKGAGMIAPNMATTLAFVATDAAVDRAWLRTVLREETARTYNEISVDGDTSTNDSLFLFASGRAGNRTLGAAGQDGAHARAFRAALRQALEDLAGQIVSDGEGATHVVSIEVSGAPDERAALKVARRVGSSPLVKTALFGSDPNWGRILCAVGNAGVDIDPERVDIHVGDVQIVANGQAVGGAQADDVAARAHAVMKQARYPIRIHLHRGRAEARHVTCDLTYEYVKINADYRT